MLYVVAFIFHIHAVGNKCICKHCSGSKNMSKTYEVQRLRRRRCKKFASLFIQKFCNVLCAAANVPRATGSPKKKRRRHFFLYFLYFRICLRDDPPSQAVDLASLL